jgi:hypothetical protein
MMVLLVGGNLEGFLEVLSWLYKTGCRCHFATSFEDACKLISCTTFDLVLSQYHLPDRTAFCLYEWLAGSQATLFLSKQVEGGCVWLLLLECGESSIGAPMLRPCNLAEAIEKLLGTKGPERPSLVRTS